MCLEDIGFHAQKQQYCVGIPEDMCTYINAQKPKTILAVIHHSMLGAKIFVSSNKVVAKPIEKSEKPAEQPPNGKNFNNDKKFNDAKKK